MSPLRRIRVDRCRYQAHPRMRTPLWPDDHAGLVEGDYVVTWCEHGCPERLARYDGHDDGGLALLTLLT